MSNIRRLDYGHPRGFTGAKVVCNNNKRKLQETNKYEKYMRKMKKIKGTEGVKSISNGARIPEDIITDILTMLPVECLLRFRCVCKSWNNLFKTTNFAKLQLAYSLKNRNEGIIIEYDTKICYLDYDSLLSNSSKLHNKLVHIPYPSEYKKQEILGSCNGLVCYISSQEDIIIWNPFTKDYKKTATPPPLPTGARRSVYLSYAFGYDLKTEDYKLVRYFAGVHAQIHFYSLKLNSWKTIAIIPLETPSNPLVFFEGFFHWVSGSHVLREMSFFDTANETVKHILLPEHFQNKFIEEAQVCVLGGLLCLIVVDLSKTVWEVWTMKDYGVTESWARMFTVDRNNYLRPENFDLKQYFKNDVILHHDGTSIFLYDLKQLEATELQISYIARWSKSYAPFFGTLISPDLSSGLGSRKQEA